MKWNLFRRKKKEKAALSDISASIPGVKEGYFVDRFYSYGEDVDFVNEKKGIRKPIIRDGVFVRFPGVDETVEKGREYGKDTGIKYAEWPDYVESKPIGPGIFYRVEFFRPNPQGETKVLWMLQPYGTPDEDGFGMEPQLEIKLSTMLDENGDYMGAFRLERVAW